jgi:D-glycero-D-manno-heptose 1,7-bisphosphate phosphatase
MNRAVFLDRDGVLNRGVRRDGKLFSPSSVEELEILDGVPDALAALHAAGFLLIVVTNQPDVARGIVQRKAVYDIHARMTDVLPLDDIRVCFHDDSDRCACRKPRPGLIYAAAVEREIDLSQSFMVGDRWRDVGAGKEAGCRTILMNRFSEARHIEPDIELRDLGETAAWILGLQVSGITP